MCEEDWGLPYLCAAEHHEKDSQLNLIMRELQIENSDNLGVLGTIPEEDWPST